MGTTGCVKHVGAIASGTCGECGHGWCEECLVFPFGVNKPPMCIACALAFAGVRHKRDRPVLPKPRLSRAERKRRKNLPKVPTVAIAESSLDEDLGQLRRDDDYDRYQVRAG